MITEDIKKDITEEFANLKEELQIHLKPDFDVSQTIQFLQTHIPNEIAHKSKILLDTQLNYLMEDARKKIKTADTKTQNAFFDADFRNRIHDWTIQLENKLQLNPAIVAYSSDPRLTQSLIAAAVTFVVVAGVSYALFSGVAGVVVSGLVTILLSAFAFKIAYDKATPKARKMVRGDIDQFLETAQKQVAEWLEKVGTAFGDDFHEFCSTNGFELKGK